jgi:cytochrome c553
MPLPRTSNARQPWLATLVTALACTTPASAQAPAAAAPPAGLPACQSCHGLAGISADGSIPNLAGQKRAYLQRQLEAFRGGERKNDLMSAIAAQLGDAEIRELAAYWAAVPPAAAPGAATPVPTRMGFPAKFPEGFTLYQTLDDAESASVSRRYANTVALNAARAEQALPDGAVILQVTHAAAIDPATRRPQLDAAGRLVAGAITSYAGMESRAGWGDAVPALLRNGNWHYAQFNADKQALPATRHASCLACHQPLQRDSHVFSLKALQEAAAR